METHDRDPTTESEPDPWNTFQEDFGGLGDRLRETYRKMASEDGPSEEEIRAAFATLASAWDQVAQSVSAALEDTEVRERLKAAASSFATAMGNTISELSSELRDGEDWRPTSPDSTAASSEEE